VREFESSHWEGQLIVHMPEKGAVLSGDALYIRQDDEEEIARLLAAIDALDAARFIDSHEDGVMTRGQVETYLREYVRTL
jgi:hypothetical protein